MKWFGPSLLAILLSLLALFWLSSWSISGEGPARAFDLEKKPGARDMDPSPAAGAAD
jgi:hypothetical protein